MENVSVFINHTSMFIAYIRRVYNIDFLVFYVSSEKFIVVVYYCLLHLICIACFKYLKVTTGT